MKSQKMWSSHPVFTNCLTPLRNKPSLDELKTCGATSLFGKQRRLTELATKAPWEKWLRDIIKSKTQFGGMDRQENLLEAALGEAIAA